MRGEGRTGRVGLVSILNDRIKDNESGIGAPLALKGPAPRRLLLMMLYVYLASYDFAEAHVGTLRPSGRSACRFANVGNIKTVSITCERFRYAIRKFTSFEHHRAKREVKEIRGWAAQVVNVLVRGLRYVQRV